MKKLKGVIQESRNWSTVLKMILIGVLLLVFLIPLQMIRALIEERNMTRLEAEGEVIAKWGGEQVIAGPVLVIPYLKRVEVEEGKTEEYVELAYFLPDTLEVAGSVDTDKRNRGIFEVTVYTADLHVVGVFNEPDFGDWRIAEQDIFWEDAAVVEFSVDPLLSRPGRSRAVQRRDSSASGAGLPSAAAKFRTDSCR